MRKVGKSIDGGTGQIRKNCYPSYLHCGTNYPPNYWLKTIIVLRTKILLVRILEKAQWGCFSLLHTDDDLSGKGPMAQWLEEVFDHVWCYLLN